MTRAEVQVAIVVVNWNTRELLAQCLQSLLTTSNTSAQPFEDGFSLTFGAYGAQVFVVDNASSDGSAQIVREGFPWVHLIENDENAGFACANNQAIRQSSGRYVLLLNSDTEVRPDAVETLVAFMEANPQAGAVGGRLLNADGSLQPSCHPMLTPWREFWRLMFLDHLARKATYGPKLWKAAVPQQVEVIKGACLLLRREALDQVGLFDESFFFYTEEVDLCYRLSQAGWQLWWVPAATVVHYGEASSKQAAQVMYLQLYRSKIQFYRKAGGEARADCFKHLVRIAYWSRLGMASVGALFSRSLARQAYTYQRLLFELSKW
jgi:N-acetylglucosaminyl-diphospho-decaprenol L-rhamnosyltransferase